MSTEKVTGSVRGLTVGALLLGVVGATCFWWVPMGLVLSLAGLLTGLIDATVARYRSLDWRLSLAAIVVSSLALLLAIVVAALGLQAVTFGGP